MSRQFGLQRLKTGRQITGSFFDKDSRLADDCAVQIEIGIIAAAPDGSKWRPKIGSGAQISGLENFWAENTVRKNSVCHRYGQAPFSHGKKSHKIS